MLCSVSTCLYNLSFFARRAAKARRLLSDHGEAQPGLWHALRPPPALLRADRCGVRERLRGAGYARWKRTRHRRRCAHVNPNTHTHTQDILSSIRFSVVGQTGIVMRGSGETWSAHRNIPLTWGHQQCLRPSQQQARLFFPHLLKEKYQLHVGKSDTEENVKYRIWKFNL